MLLKDTQVAERLGCARSSVWCMALAGTLPRPIKRGKKWSRWPSAEIDLVEQAITNSATDEELRTLTRELMAARSREAA
jgi:predicted DNA-binding transcriptional regulator AlpA